MIIKTSVFLSSLKIVCKSIGKKNAISLLTNVYIKIFQNTMEFSGINNDMSLNISMDLENFIEEKIDILVNGHLLLDVVSKIDDDYITLIFSEQFLTIKTAISTQNINRVHQHFPMESFAIGEKHIELSGDVLLKLLNDINIKTDNVKLIYKDNVFTVANYDRRRFAINSHNIPSDYEDFIISINRKTLQETVKIFNGKLPIKLMKHNNSFIFSQNNINILLRTINDGPFSYERFMDLSLYINWTIDSALLKKAIDRVLAVTDGLAKFVRMNFKGPKLTISGFDPNLGSAISEITTNNEDILDCQININGLYLLETLQCFDSKIPIIINIANNIKPIILEQSHIKHIIIPIRG